MRRSMLLFLLLAEPAPEPLLCSLKPAPSVTIELPPRLPRLPERDLETPPGLTYRLALCPQDDKETEKTVMKHLKSATTRFKMLCHDFAKPVKVDTCFEGSMTPGYIYVDTIYDLRDTDGTDLAGLAEPVPFSGFALSGVFLVDTSKIDVQAVYDHELGHILGYSHAREGIMTPSLDRIPDDPSFAGMSVCFEPRVRK